MKFLGVIAPLSHALGCLAFTSHHRHADVGPIPKKVELPSSPSSRVPYPLRRPRTTTIGRASSSSPFDFIKSILPSSSGSSTKDTPPKPRMPDVVIDPDYTLAASFGIIGISIIVSDHGGVGGVVGGGFVSLLASLFAVQATRLRFVFDETCFELKTLDSIYSTELRDSGENIIVGGANRWGYDSFVNWDFYPSPSLPILVYFKETQTKRTDGKGSGDDGQIHFFPAGAWHSFPLRKKK